MWYRVFASSNTEIDPAKLLEFAQGDLSGADGNFRGDEDGWFQVILMLNGESLKLNRYLVSEEGIRAELNAWAAWVELVDKSPQGHQLMEAVVNTQQLFTLQNEISSHQDLCHRLCRFLAQETDGIYQIDSQGIFSRDGDLLLAEK